MWVLVVVIAVLLAERLWHERMVIAERRKFVNALVARDARELGYLDRVDAAPPPKASTNGEDARRPMPEGL